MSIAPNVKTAIEALECPIHHEGPILVTDKGDRLIIKCCCAKFRKECQYLIDKLVSYSPKGKPGSP